MFDILVRLTIYVSEQPEVTNTNKITAPAICRRSSLKRYLHVGYWMNFKIFF